MPSKIMKTKGQDVETLIHKGIFICLELWVLQKIESLNQIKKFLSCLNKFTMPI